MVVFSSLMKLSAFAVSVGVLSLPSAVVADVLCSPSNKCPKSAPACSQYGYCGTSAAHSRGGCDPNGSYKPTSCAAMPRCKNHFVSFHHHAKHHIDVDKFDGDANKATFTLDSGRVRHSDGGIYLDVTQSGKGAAGAQLSSTRYIYYGRVTTRMRHANNQGIVASFILLSNTRDEQDWEFTTSNPRMAQTNWFKHWSLDGAATYGNAFTPNLPSDFNVQDWHSYTIDWQPEAINFEIDGYVVKTVYRSQTQNSQGTYDFPATPSRIQLAMWSSQDVGSGTASWTGGQPNWAAADPKYNSFWSEVKSVNITCYDPPLGKGPNYQFSHHIDPVSGQYGIISSHDSSHHHD